MRALAIFLMLFWSSFAQAASILPPVPFTFTNGTTADATQVNANFNSIITNTNTFAAENGANASITSLTGLTTPLPASEGGTGLTSFTLSLSAPVSIGQGGTGQTSAVTAFNALSPLTTQGDVLYFDGTNNARLGPGTAGQFLQTQGGGANPVWATPASAGNPYFVNVRFAPYNAACNGSTDDTAAIQAAITATQGSGNGIFIPGFCVISSALTISNALEIRGAGDYSRLIMNNTSQDGIDITGIAPVILSNFMITAAGSQVAGAGVRCSSGGGTNSGTIIENMFFPSLYDGVVGVTGCIDVKIVDNNFSVYGHHAIDWANASVVNQGNISILGNNFRQSGSVGTAIFVNNAGGYRIVSNKVNFGNVGILVQYNTGNQVATDVLIANNSIEGPASGCVEITRLDSTVAGNIQIVGNQFEDGAANETLVSVDPSTGAAWISGLVINDNIFQFGIGGASAIAINMNRATEAVAVGNTVTGSTPGDGATIGIGMDIGATMVGKSSANYLARATTSTSNGAGSNWVVGTP